MVGPPRTWNLCPEITHHVVAFARTEETPHTHERVSHRIPRMVHQPSVKAEKEISHSYLITLSTLGGITTIEGRRNSPIVSQFLTVSTARSSDGFRRTLVGLKELVDHRLSPSHRGFRRTLVGLKEALNSCSVRFRWFQTNPCGIEGLISQRMTMQCITFQTNPCGIEALGNTNPAFYT